MTRGTDRRAYMAAWRAANKAKTQAYFAALYVQKRDAGVFKEAAYIEKCAAYYLATKAHHAAANAARKKADPESARRHQHTRRAKAKRIGGKLSKGITAKLMMLQRGKCANCLTKLVKHHIDHVQPISKGGENTDTNVQLLCPTCNLKKHNKDPIDFAQQQGRLL